MKIFQITLFLTLFIPGLVLAKVSVSEVAWMGIDGANGQYGEWLELYNDSDDAVSVAGWKLYSDGGGQLVFTLTKSIPGHSYFLIERTTASMTDPVLGVDDESGPFGGGGLSNSGENLVLKDTSDQIIDSLNFSSGWPAGDSTTKQTMQWDGSKWVTAVPTPKAPYNSGGGNEGSSTVITSGSQAYQLPKNTPHIEFVFPNNIYPGVEYDFTATPILEYGSPSYGVFKWNMGDGYFNEKKNDLNPISHSYKYPGTYTVSFAYYYSDYDKKPVLSGTKIIEVIKPTIEITNPDNNSIQIKNKTNKSIDLSGWKIEGVTPNVSLPPMTIIAPNATINIPKGLLGIDSINSSTLGLLSPTGAKMTSSTNIITGRTTTFVKNNKILEANAIEAISQNTDNQESINIEDKSETVSKTNHIKIIIFSIIGIVVIFLVVLLERLMKKNDQY